MGWLLGVVVSAGVAAAVGLFVTRHMKRAGRLVILEAKATYDDCENRIQILVSLRNYAEEQRLIRTPYLGWMVPIFDDNGEYLGVKFGIYELLDADSGVVMKTFAIESDGVSEFRASMDPRKLPADFDLGDIYSSFRGYHASINLPMVHNGSVISEDFPKYFGQKRQRRNVFIRHEFD